MRPDRRDRGIHSNKPKPQGRRRLSHSEKMEAWGKLGPLPSADPPHLPDFWGRACRILVLLILFLIPVLSPLRLPDEWIEKLRGSTTAWWHWFYTGQIDTFINYGYAPLPLKEGAFRILVVILLVCWYVRQVGRSWSKIGPGNLRFDWTIYGPIAAFLAWCALSLLWTPTFFYSLKTYAMVAVGVLWFGVVYEMPKSSRLVRRWLNMILLASGIVAFFAFLQDVDRGRWITGLIFPNIAEAAKHDPYLLRLRMGSLIGHNIGVASLLSFAWFILLARLFQPSSRKRKLARGCYLAFLFYVILALQTRGIWLSLLFLTPLHLWWLIRLTGIRWDPKPVLGVILIVLIILTLQIIPSPRNPFYSPQSPLLLRFTHFRLSHLLTETRLRIALCSGSLVADKPLTGHGLGSFQYVYPDAQANYFARHPDTFIVPGARRTMRAHDDWLQLMIELGLPGLLIVVAGLYLALRRGWIGWSRLRNPTLRLELTAALMAVACVMLHAFVNFPIHVVSTAAPAVFFLAIWASCARIGRREEPSRNPAAATESEIATARGARITATVALAAIVPAAIGACAWFYSILHASMYETLGSSYRAYYGDHFQEMNDRKRRYVIGMALAVFKQGHKEVPLDQELTFRFGEASVLKGVLAYLESRKLTGADERTKRARAARRYEARNWLGQGIKWLQTCQQEVKYHEVFHYLGMAYEHLYRVLGNEDDRQKAKEYYAMAARYSPAFARSVYRLFELLQLDRPPNEAELRKRCRQIARYDPALFQRQFVEQVLETVRRRDYELALQKLNVVLDAQPDVPNHWLLKAHLLAFMGRGEAAQGVLEKFSTIFPKIPRGAIPGYRMEAALAAGDYEKAVSFSKTAEQVPGSAPLVPYCRCVRAVALEKLGRPEAGQLWATIEKEAKKDLRYQTSLAEALLYLVREPDRAYPYLVRAARSDPPPDAALIRVAAEMSWKRGQEKQAVEFLERALALDPKDPKARRLLNEWERSVGK